MSGFAASYAANTCILMILYDMIDACTILLYNRTHTEGRKSCANHGPVYTLENFQWCREPCFAGAEILGGRCLPQIPRRGKLKPLLI
jgi:hypothetical protein